MFAGQNVVRGDKESIKNLVEIFDGLLEYLNEEISEESQNGGRLSDFVHLRDKLSALHHLFSDFSKCLA